MLDHLPRETNFLLCDPESLAVHADSYAEQIPAKDPFYISWPDFLTELNRRGLASVELEDDLIRDVAAESVELPAQEQTGGPPALATLRFGSLDAFRPLADRAPEPQIAETQRREFFQQLHRWIRQDYGVHLFCNNDGERQRFGEIWKELGFGPADATAPVDSHRFTCPRLHLRIGKPNWWSSPMRKYSGATRSSGRAA